MSGRNVRFSANLAQIIIGVKNLKDSSATLVQLKYICYVIQHL